MADIGIFDNDLLGDVVHWSARQGEIFDSHRGERVTLAKMLERVHPEDRAAVRESTATSEAPGSDGWYDVDCRVVRRDAVVRFVSGRARTFFEGLGEERRAAGPCPGPLREREGAGGPGDRRMGRRQAGRQPGERGRRGDGRRREPSRPPSPEKALGCLPCLSTPAASRPS